MTGPPPSAIILAAGRSERMGSLKPLLPLGDGTVLSQVISLFQNCGVSDVRVVLGHRAERIGEAAREAGAIAVVNPDYDAGMYSSVAAGVQTLPADCPAFFILPVDVALARPMTLAWLLESPLPGPLSIRHPVFAGKRGHPPLIGIGHRPHIMAYGGAEGLRGYLKTWSAWEQDSPVADAYILSDMDTPPDYERARIAFDRRHILSPAECRYLILEQLRQPPALWEHCLAVAALSLKIGKALNKRGAGLDLDLVASGALVHDLAKGQKNHARQGAEFLRRIGLPQLADIVAAHMELPEQSGDPPREAEIVFLADKRLAGDRRVSLASRFMPRITQSGDDPAALAAARRRLSQALRIQEAIARLIGRDLDEILAEELDDLFLSPAPGSGLP